MNLSSLKNKIERRNHYRNTQEEFQDIGNVIKDKRKKMNMTQDAISKGICSISYLSKIENNQIIPNEFFVKEIMERLEVDDLVVDKTINDLKTLRQLTYDIFYNRTDSIIQLYEEIKSINHNVVINVCKLGCLLNLKKQGSNQYVLMLENLVYNMSNYELKAFLFFSTEYFINRFVH